jgi:hypothetical protein
MFAVKFAYLLDHRVFQNFVDRLGDHCSEKQPIKKARKTLEHSQAAATQRAMIGFEVGTAPRLFLPSSLRANPAEDKGQLNKKFSSRKRTRRKPRKDPKN